MPTDDPILNQQPDTYSPLTDVKFRLIIPRLPNVQYFAQKVEIPGISIPTVFLTTPALNVPMAGSGVSYGELSVTFMVDKGFNNFFEIRNWMVGLSDSLGSGKYSDVKKEGLWSDVALQVLTNKDQPNMVFTFRNAFPTSLSGVLWDAQSETVQYLYCTAKFAYMEYSKD